MRLTPLVFDLMGIEVTKREGLGILQKLEVIHQHVFPEKQGDMDLDPESKE